jgi:hypothetical protein
MIIDYPVQLFPLSVNIGGEESSMQTSPGEPTFAVISHNKIVAKARNPKDLGINYSDYTYKSSTEKTGREISYEPPFQEHHTKEAIFNVKPLGANHKHEFQIGCLFALEKIVNETQSTEKL